jgi:uncharacterized damage-inducible protein DinB
MDNIIKNISEEKWNKQFPSHWKSIHELCSHIFFGNYTWLNEFRLFVNSKHLSNEYFNKNFVWGELLFKEINEYLTLRKDLDDKIIVFIDEIMNDDLEKIMTWIDWEGKEIKKKLGIYIMHMFNHATHHRAQVSLYLDMLGMENDFSIFFSRD